MFALLIPVFDSSPLSRTPPPHKKNLLQRISMKLPQASLWMNAGGILGQRSEQEWCLKECIHSMQYVCLQKKTRWSSLSLCCFSYTQTATVLHLCDLNVSQKQRPQTRLVSPLQRNLSLSHWATVMRSNATQSSRSRKYVSIKVNHIFFMSKTTCSRSLKHSKTVSSIQFDWQWPAKRKKNK